MGAVVPAWVGPGGGGRGELPRVPLQQLGAAQPALHHQLPVQPGPGLQVSAARPALCNGAWARLVTRLSCAEVQVPPVRRPAPARSLCRGGGSPGGEERAMRPCSLPPCRVMHARRRRLREFIRHHEQEIRGKHTSLDVEGALNKWTVPAMEDQGIPKTFGFQNRAVRRPPAHSASRGHTSQCPSEVPASCAWTTTATRSLHPHPRVRCIGRSTMRPCQAWGTYRASRRPRSSWWPRTTPSSGERHSSPRQQRFCPPMFMAAMPHTSIFACASGGCTRSASHRQGGRPAMLFSVHALGLCLAADVLQGAA